MTSIKELRKMILYRDKELTPDRLREEIRAREDCKSALGGPLWPGVLRDEIAELKRALEALGGG